MYDRRNSFIVWALAVLTIFTPASTYGKSEGANEIASEYEHCVTHTVTQTISEEGCHNMIIQSRSCTGHCFSSWIPYVEGMEVEEQTCTGCIPVETRAKVVYLHCPGVSGGRKQIEVEEATRCRCTNISCGDKVKAHLSSV